MTLPAADPCARPPGNPRRTSIALCSFPGPRCFTTPVSAPGLPALRAGLAAVAALDRLEPGVRSEVLSA